MLREIKYVNQIPGEPRKTWYTDDFFDLFVWFDEDHGIVSFQLSYGKPSNEKMLSWNRRSGMGHSKVDDGEQDYAIRKASPILVRDGPVADTLAIQFKNESRDIDGNVSAFVVSKIEQFFRDTSRPTVVSMPAVRPSKSE